MLIDGNQRHPVPCQTNVFGPNTYIPFSSSPSTTPTGLTLFPLFLQVWRMLQLAARHSCAGFLGPSSLAPGAVCSLQSADPGFCTEGFPDLLSLLGYQPPASLVTWVACSCHPTLQLVSVPIASVCPAEHVLFPLGTHGSSSHSSRG